MRSSSSHKIVHILATGKSRGAETFATLLMEQLYLKAFKQKVIFLSGLSVEIELPPGVEPIYREAYANTRIAELFWLRRFLRANRSSVVICHGQSCLKQVFFSLIFMRRRPIVIVKAIGMLLPWIGNKNRQLRMLLNRLFFSSADRCIVLGERQKQELIDPIGIDDQKIIKIGNARKPPENIEAAGAITRFEERLLFVGSLSPEKKPDLALDIFMAVKKTIPEASISFCGDGPMRANLEKRAQESLYNESIHFHGRVDDVTPYYRSSGLLLLCSETEGVPGVVIEASFTGLPSICWDVGDVRAVLEDDINGFVTPFGDKVLLSEKIISVLMDKLLYKKLRASTFEKSDQFKIESVALEYIHLIERLKQGRNAP